MLIYHPAFDAYHCTFRMLVVVKQLQSLEVEKARILDFFLAFPGALSNVRLPQALRRYRKLISGATNPYRDPVSAKRTFADMTEIQMSALRCIAAAGLIDPGALADGHVQQTKEVFPNQLDESLGMFIRREGAVAAFILGDFGGLPLRGSDGLKDRTELLEHRYDAA